MTRAAARAPWRSDRSTTVEPSQAPRLRARSPASFERLLRPLHRWVWASPRRRADKLARFAETESHGGHDIARAAELTADGLLRRLYLRHAIDEQRHADLFRARAWAIARSLPPAPPRRFEGNWLSPGERGLDELRVGETAESAFLAFLHLSEKAAARRFAVYRDVLEGDPATRDVFTQVLRDEAFHMKYTHAQLQRIAPQRSGLRLWAARAARLWKGYLRIAAAIGNFMGSFVLTAQYFLVLPVFALLAKRAETKAPQGWIATGERANADLRSQY